MIFHGGHAVDAVVVDRCREYGIGTGAERIADVVGGANAAGRDDRRTNRIGHRGEERKVAPVTGSVPVPTGEQDLTGAEVDTGARPRHGVAPGPIASPVHQDLPFLVRAPGVDGEHDALAPETGGQFRDQGGVADRGRIHGHLVGAGVQQPRRVRYRSDPAADGERDVELGADVANGIDSRVLCFG